MTHNTCTQHPWSPIRSNSCVLRYALQGTTRMQGGFNENDSPSAARASCADRGLQSRLNLVNSIECNICQPLIQMNRVEGVSPIKCAHTPGVELYCSSSSHCESCFRCRCPPPVDATVSMLTKISCDDNDDDEDDSTSSLTGNFSSWSCRGHSGRHGAESHRTRLTGL